MAKEFLTIRKLIRELERTEDECGPNAMVLIDAGGVYFTVGQIKRRKGHTYPVKISEGREIE